MARKTKNAQIVGANIKWAEKREKNYYRKNPLKEVQKAKELADLDIFSEPVVQRYWDAMNGIPYSEKISSKDLAQDIEKVKEIDRVLPYKTQWSKKETELLKDKSLVMPHDWVEANIDKIDGQTVYQCKFCSAVWWEGDFKTRTQVLGESCEPRRKAYLKVVKSKNFQEVYGDDKKRWDKLQINADGSYTVTLEKSENGADWTDARIEEKAQMDESIVDMYQKWAIGPEMIQLNAEVEDVKRTVDLKLQSGGIIRRRDGMFERLREVIFNQLRGVRLSSEEALELMKLIGTTVEGGMEFREQPSPITIRKTIPEAIPEKAHKRKIRGLNE